MRHHPLQNSTNLKINEMVESTRGRDVKIVREKQRKDVGEKKVVPSTRASPLALASASFFFFGSGFAALAAFAASRFLFFS